MKDRWFGFLFALMIALALCSCVTMPSAVTVEPNVTVEATEPIELIELIEPAETDEAVEEVEAVEAVEVYVTYIQPYSHDPRENPEAMKDIIENPAAVYYFSPDPLSKSLGTYASYDWTDPVFVAKARQERIQYHEDINTMIAVMSNMAADGESIENIARAVSAERNRIRLAQYQNDPETLADIKKSNFEKYGHEDGPTADEQYDKYGSWEIVIEKAFTPNLGMDTICGLYDEYYPLYVMLGYAY